jgi:hypothetical protein
MTTRTLKSLGLHVTTVDIDSHLCADILASVEDVPLPNDTADVVLCCEVLEHLPFERLAHCIRELARLATKGIVISVPDVERYVSLEIAGNSFRPLRVFREFPRRPRKRPKKCWCDQHYWEIGASEYPLERVTSTIESGGVEILRTYRVFEIPYHRFFVLQKHGPGSP